MPMNMILLLFTLSRLWTRSGIECIVPAQRYETIEQKAMLTASEIHKGSDAKNRMNKTNNTTNLDGSFDICVSSIFL